MKIFLPGHLGSSEFKAYSLVGIRKPALRSGFFIAARKIICYSGCTIKVLAMNRKNFPFGIWEYVFPVYYNKITAAFIL